MAVLTYKSRPNTCNALSHLEGCSESILNSWAFHIKSNISNSPSSHRKRKYSTIIYVTRSSVSSRPPRLFSGFKTRVPSFTGDFVRLECKQFAYLIYNPCSHIGLLTLISVPNLEGDVHSTDGSARSIPCSHLRGTHHMGKLGETYYKERSTI